MTATPKAYLKNINIEQLEAENPKALEARQLRDTYHYFGCKPGFPTFRYDIIDAVKDPEGPFLCLPKIFDLRSDITTKALAESGWAVVINEQEENFKIQDLERKIFTPARNRVMCEAFLKEAQKDPDRNHRQIHRLRREPDARDQPDEDFQRAAARHRRHHHVAHTRRLRPLPRSFATANAPSASPFPWTCSPPATTAATCSTSVLMRPIFSPTEYIQIKGRGTRLFHLQDRQHRIREEEFLPAGFLRGRRILRGKIRLHPAAETPAPRRTGSPANRRGTARRTWSVRRAGHDPNHAANRAEKFRPWEGIDTLVSLEVRIVGPNGEKVDIMTFRGGYERDIKEFVEKTPALKAAVEAEDDDAIETIVNERFYHRPEMFYSPDKLIVSYGVPATTPAFVYNALGRKPLPTREAIVTDTVDSIAARFNLRYSEQKWLDATAQLLAEDSAALRRFMTGDMTLFTASQFNQLGGVSALAAFRGPRAGLRSLAPVHTRPAIIDRSQFIVNYHAPSTHQPRFRCRPKSLARSNFFSSGLRQKVDQLMNILWAGGVNNPMDSIEQISYLLFLRLLTEKDEALATPRQEIHPHLLRQMGAVRLGQLRHADRRQPLQCRPRRHREALHELPGLTDTGKLLFSRATLKIYDRPTLRAVVQGIHDLDLAAHDGHDFKGDMYEYLLSKLSASGTNGQFRTPRHIIDLIVALVNPQPGQRICDPACGTAGFLISAFTHILRQHTKPADLKRGLVDGALLKPAQWKFLEEQAFTGFDNDANMVKIAILNLYLHQLEKAQVSMMNPLTTGFGGAYPGQRSMSSSPTRRSPERCRTKASSPTSTTS